MNLFSKTLGDSTWKGWVKKSIINVEQTTGQERHLSLYGRGEQRQTWDTKRISSVYPGSSQTPCWPKAPYPWRSFPPPPPAQCVVSVWVTNRVWYKWWESLPGQDKVISRQPVSEEPSHSILHKLSRGSFALGELGIRLWGHIGGHRKACVMTATLNGSLQTLSQNHLVRLFPDSWSQKLRLMCAVVSC